MRKILFLLLCVVGFSAGGQSLSPSVLATAGGNYSGPSTQFSWTLGETFTQTLTAGSTVFTQGFQQAFPSLSLANPSFSVLCAGKPFSVSYTADLIKGSGNIFTVQLSDASGSFTSPVAVGSRTSTESGSVTCILPPGTAPGTGYRLRVVSSDPALSSRDNGSNLTVISSPDLTALSPSQAAISAQILLLGSNLSGVNAVRFNGLAAAFTIQSASQITATVPSGATSGVVVITNASGCSDTLAGFQVISQTCAVPVANPAPGTFGPAPTVSLSSATEGATIYFTTNGTLPGPTNASSRIYTQPIPITSASVTLKARAFRDGFTQSAPFSGVYNVTQICAPVVIQPGTGSYSGSTLVTLTCSTPGVTIYYSPTGNVPVPGTTFTRIYTGPFFVNSTTTIRALAMRTGYLDGPVAVATLTVTTAGTLPGVEFSPAPGTYATSPTISLSCPEPGTTIYYTTNGNAPLPGAGFTLIYSGPFMQVSSGTIRAMATKSGFTNSAVAVGNYTVTQPAIVATPIFSPLPGNCPPPCQVSISTTTPESAIWFTTTGNTPDPASPLSRLYSTPLNLAATTTLKARAFRTGFQSSAVATGIYTIVPGRAAGDESAEGTGLLVYPNPGTGLYRLAGAGPGEEVSLRIFSADGRIIHRSRATGGEEEPCRFSLEGQPKGVYLLEAEVSGRVERFRLVLM